MWLKCLACEIVLVGWFRRLRGESLINPSDDIRIEPARRLSGDAGVQFMPVFDA